MFFSRLFLFLFAFLAAMCAVSVAHTPRWKVIPEMANKTEASFRCDYKYSNAAEGWFKHFVVPATWYDARLRCSLEGAVLASPTTPDIKAEMINIINYSFSTESEIFTGIHATLSPGDYFTVEGVPLSEFPITWAENEPDNLNNNERCITFNGKGDLADRSCEGTRSYICYRSALKDEKVNVCGTVDPEYQLDTRTNSCYKFHTVPRNFWRANLACFAEGGHLAIINSETEHKVIKDIFDKYPANKIVGTSWTYVAFIGFSDWGERGDWRTIHGETLLEAGFDKFAQDQPNNLTTGQYCGSVLRNDGLADFWCNTPTAFICEKNPDYPAVCQVLPEEEEREEEINNNNE